jgi:superfamily I DNA/RNA helicase
MTNDQQQVTDGVRVGTFHRSKGLEFKVVFLLGLESYPTRMKRGEAATTFDDRHELELNVTFVAMIRAREMLELICKGEPSAPFQGAREYFDLFAL